MSEITFDTLEYFNELKKVGVPEETARVHTEALKKALGGKLATQKDIENLRKEIIELEVRLEYKLIVKLGAVTVACSAIILALLPYILK